MTLLSACETNGQQTSITAVGTEAVTQCKGQTEASKGPSGDHA